jgi:hypothetical protein
VGLSPHADQDQGAERRGIHRGDGARSAAGVKAISGNEACTATTGDAGGGVALRWVDGLRDDRLTVSFACAPYAGSTWERHVRDAAALLKLSRPIF